MDEELIRAACEAANCKYPDMEAMANFKREVTPSAVIGLLDGLRHAKGMAAINDARANGAAEIIQHLRDDIAELRAQLPSQGGEAVEVVGVRISSDGFGSYIADSAMGTGPLYPGDVREPLMTVAQHQRILAAATHPADQVADPSKQIAWKRRDGVMGCKRFMTQKFYEAQSPQMKGNYEPFYCAHCVAGQLAEPDAELVEAVEFAARSLAQITSSDGSGHADIAVGVLRMAGFPAVEREALIGDWKSKAQWRIDAKLASLKP